MRSLFLASGQVGHDLAALDWQATPLGDPESWPQSLKTVVQVLLTSRFSMWMAWGPELTFFANETYRRDTLGAKYPWALGKPAREVWSEIWGDIGPRIEHVISTGEATWDESLMLILERSGFPEETYHTFSYSPLTDDAGNIAGMLCVVSEETRRVVNELRMAILRDLGAALTDARTESEVCAVAARQLSRDLKRLPFSLIYLFEEGGDQAVLAAAAGARVGEPVAPARLVEPDQVPWPLKAARRGQSTLVSGLSGRFQRVPTGDWSEPPTDALVVPLAWQAHEPPYGLLVAGLNRYRPFEPEYEGFLGLVGAQIASSLANARAYEAERRRAETLAELDRAKTAFFTNVSHEFRTPLTLLLGPASDALADRDEPLGPAQQARMELIERNGERLLRLVNTLLDFSRLEAGEATAELEPVRLASYTRELAEMFRAATERAALNLEIDVDDGGAPTLVDREAWAKIVSNLLSNAVKFTFSGGITVRLRRVEHDGEATVELSVADTGIGIDPTDQVHLFERFHRVSGARSRTYEGSGIGLALVAELAELHGGAASATSAPGVGSTFTVSIPARQGGADVGVHSSADLRSVRDLTAGFVEEALRWLSSGEEPEEGAAGRHGERPRVLVVDDNSDMRRYVASLLESHYRIETATDGVVALERVRQAVPDLVLTDVMMPNLDGFGLLRALREDPRTAHVPIVLLSARAGEESAVEGLESGADDYLIKPFSAQELVARVRANLELQRARRAVGDQERRIAEDLQQSLAPSEQATIEHLEVATLYEPGVRGTQVGGDWYDVIELGAGRMALVIGDVMGRGVRAAAIMGQLRAAVRAYARLDLAPADLLEFMDQTVRDLGEGEIVTCVYAVYDPAEQTLTYANAGHLPPLLVTPGEGVRRLGDGLSAPLGAGPGSLDQVEVAFRDASALLLYTDGLVERRGADIDARIDLLAELVGDHPGAIDRLPALLAETLCPDGSEDDVAILYAKVPSSREDWKVAEAEIDPEHAGVAEARRIVTETLEGWQVSRRCIDDLVLMASELVTNAIIHGRPPVRVRLRRTEREVLLEVLDGANYVPRKLRPTPLDEHGRGLHIVGLLAHRWGIRLTESGKSTWCTVQLTAAAPAERRAT